MSKIWLPSNRNSVIYVLSTPYISSNSTHIDNLNHDSPFLFSPSVLIPRSYSGFRNPSPTAQSAIVVGNSAFSPRRSLSHRESRACRNLSNIPDLVARNHFFWLGWRSQEAQTNCVCVTAGRGPNKLRIGKKPLQCHGFHRGSRQTNTFIAKSAISR